MDKLTLQVVHLAESDCHSVCVTTFLWVIIIINMSLHCEPQATSPLISVPVTHYLAGCACVYMSNYNSYEGALVSVTGVNYVLSRTAEEPDSA